MVIYVCFFVCGCVRIKSTYLICITRTATHRVHLVALIRRNIRAFREADAFC